MSSGPRAWQFVSKPRFPVVHRGEVTWASSIPTSSSTIKVNVEVKSASAFDRVFEAQVLTYLRVTKLQRALLLNFGRALMRDGIHRFVQNGSGSLEAGLRRPTV